MKFRHFIYLPWFNPAPYGTFHNFRDRSLYSRSPRYDLYWTNARSINLVFFRQKIRLQILNKILDNIKKYFFINFALQKILPVFYLFLLFFARSKKLKNDILFFFQKHFTTIRKTFSKQQHFNKNNNNNIVIKNVNNFCYLLNKSFVFFGPRILI